MQAVSCEQTDRQLTLMLAVSLFAVSLWRSVDLVRHNPTVYSMKLYFSHFGFGGRSLPASNLTESNLVFD